MLPSIVVNCRNLLRASNNSGLLLISSYLKKKKTSKLLRSQEIVVEMLNNELTRRSLVLQQGDVMCITQIRDQTLSRDSPPGSDKFAQR